MFRIFVISKVRGNFYVSNKNNLKCFIVIKLCVLSFPSKRINQG